MTVAHKRGGSRSQTVRAPWADRHGAIIGVGAVMVHSVPPRGVAVGDPARIISCAGALDLIDYPGMDDDPDRLASLAKARRSADAVQPR